MTFFKSGLKSSLRISALATAIGIMSASSAAAYTCGIVNSNWVNQFNDGPDQGVDEIYDCDNDFGPVDSIDEANCAELAPALACCTDPSPFATETDCICTVYTNNPDPFDAIPVAGRNYCNTDWTPPAE